MGSRYSIHNTHVPICAPKRRIPKHPCIRKLIFLFTDDDDSDEIIFLGSTSSSFTRPAFHFPGALLIRKFQFCEFVKNKQTKLYPPPHIQFSLNSSMFNNKCHPLREASTAAAPTKTPAAHSPYYLYSKSRRSSSHLPSLP